MALTVRVTSDSMTKALKSIAILDGESRLAIESGMKRGMGIMVRDAKKHVPVKTGKLLRSIHYSYNKNKVMGKIYGGDKRARHGHLIEYGVRGMNIVPKIKPYMIFKGTHQWKGKWIRAKHVSVPRRAAHPFLIPAVENNTDNMVNAIKTKMKKRMRH